ncbi:UNVERIFIED_ORG: hypothetical protein J2W82_001286 [Pseudomonas mohnii]|nr:hypothetical protein [Pseudomonas mohnii]
MAAIALEFLLNEGIQHLNAVAWRLLVESAVKFNDKGCVALAMAKLDELCHERDGEVV